MHLTGINTATQIPSSINMNTCLDNMEWALDHLEPWMPSTRMTPRANPLSGLALLTEDYHDTLTQRAFQDGLQQVQELQDFLVTSALIQQHAFTSSTSMDELVDGPLFESESESPNMFLSHEEPLPLNEKQDALQASLAAAPAPAPIKNSSRSSKPKKPRVKKSADSSNADHVYSVPGGTGWQFVVKANGKISRPPNAFILYRFEKHQELWSEYKSSLVQTGQGNNTFSAMLGKMWKTEAKEIKEHYMELARKVKQEHNELFPHYKYMPRVHCPEQAKELSQTQSRFIQGPGTVKRVLESDDEECQTDEHKNDTKKIKLETLPLSPPLTPCTETNLYPLDDSIPLVCAGSGNLFEDASDVLSLFN